MISLDDAKKMFEKMVQDSPKNYQIENVWEIKFDEPLYVMTVIDEHGERLFPGEAFPSINKNDGSLVNWTLPLMG